MPKPKGLGLQLGEAAHESGPPCSSPRVPRTTGGRRGLPHVGSFTKGAARQAAGVVLSETHATPSRVVYPEEAFGSAGEAPDGSAHGKGALGSVYVGSVHAFWNTEWLLDHDVGFVLNCAGALERNFGERHTAAVDAALAAGLTIMQIPWKDTVFTDLEPLLPLALTFIATARATGKSVLVHCAAGRSRSVTVCLSYFMLVTGLACDVALARLSKRHPTCEPNPGFHSQVRELAGEVDALEELVSASKHAAAAAAAAAGPASQAAAVVDSGSVSASATWLALLVALPAVERGEGPEVSAFPERSDGVIIRLPPDHGESEAFGSTQVSREGMPGRSRAASSMF